MRSWDSNERRSRSGDRARKVVKRYGATTALAGLSLDVRDGEMFGLIGPDGAGKTTAIRLMCGLLHADAGELRVLGLDPVHAHRAAHRARRLSLAAIQSLRRSDHRREHRVLCRGPRRSRLSRARRDQLLSMTQLTPFRGRLADRLSGGMKQKLALACTLVHEPELILLDEPTTGVDPISRREFWKLLSEFLANGITILMSTPYLDEAERCTRVALVHEGRVLAIDEPARLRDAHSGPHAGSHRARRRRRPTSCARLPGVVDAQVFGERIHVTLDDGGDEREERVQGGAARDAAGERAGAARCSRRSRTCSSPGCRRSRQPVVEAAVRRRV